MAYAAMMQSGLGALPSCMTPAMITQLHSDWAAWRCDYVGDVQPSFQTGAAYAYWWRCRGPSNPDALVKRLGVPPCAEYTVPKGTPCEHITDVEYATCLRDKVAHGETLKPEERAFLDAHPIVMAFITPLKFAAPPKTPPKKPTVEAKAGVSGTAIAIVALFGIGAVVLLLRRRRQT